MSKIKRERLYRMTAAKIADALPVMEMRTKCRLRACGGFMMWREWLDSGRVSLRAASFCNRVRLCPGCAHWAAVRSVAKSLPVLEHLIQDGGLVPLLMTFTIKDGDELDERFGVLQAGLRAVGQRVRQSRRKNSRSSFAGILGAIARVEVKRGKNSGQWHPHAHALVLRDRFERFPLSEQQAEWRSLVGRGNLDVRLTRAGRAIVSGAGVDQAQLQADLCEVVKYAMKFGEMTPADVVDAYHVLHKKRLAYSWGNCYGMKPEPPGVDLDQFAGEWRDFSAKWNMAELCYQVALSATGYRSPEPAAAAASTREGADGKDAGEDVPVVVERQGSLEF